MPTANWSRIARLAVAAGALTVFVADLLVLTYQESSTPVSLQASIDGFRRGEPVASTTTVLTVGPPTSAPAARSAETSAVGGPAAVGRPGPAASGPRPLHRPLEGVYAYATSGEESISLGSAKHSYPAETYATVRHEAGCRWRAEHRIVEEHVEHAVDCTEVESVQLLENGARISFYGQSGEETYACHPPILLFTPSDPPGTARNGVCSNDRGREEHQQTLIGDEQITVGSGTVRTRHIRTVVTISGRGDGTARYDTWLDAATGLKVKESRSVDSTAHEFGTSIRYTETATFRLLSMTPNT